MRLFSFVFAATSVISATVALAVDRYQCDITRKPDADWVSDTYVLFHDTSANAVSVVDPLALYFNDNEPLTANVIKDTSAQFRIGWQVAIKDGDGQKAIMFYSATYFKKNGKVTVAAKPGGYANNFIGRGTCKLSKG